MFAQGSAGISNPRFHYPGRPLFTWRSLHPMGEGKRCAVRDILETPDGQIWIGTTQGIASYDGHNWTWFNDETTGGVVPTAVATSLIQRADGTLWAALWSNGTSWHDGERWHTGPALEGAPRPDRYAYRLHEDRTGTLWLGAWRGELYRLTEGQWEAEPLPLPDAGVDLGVRDIQERPNGDIWVLAVSGLYIGSPAAEGDDPVATQQRIWSYVSLPFPLNHAFPTSIAFLSDTPDSDYVITQYGGGMWIHHQDRWLSMSGDERISPRTWAATVLDDHNPHLPSEGRLWLATFGDGAASVPIGPEWLEDRIEHRVSAFNANNGLDHNVVYCIEQLRDGSILVGTYNGLSHYAPSRWHVLGLKDGFPGRVSRSLLQTAPNTIWVASDRGVVRISHDGMARYSRRDGLPSGDVRVLRRGPAETLWCGTSRGIARWTGDHWENFPSPPEAGEFPVSALAWLPNGALLAGTSGLGLWRYDGQWEMVAGNSSPAEGPKASVEIVTDIFVHDDGTASVAAYGGLHRLSADGDLELDTSLDALDSDHDQYRNTHQVRRVAPHLLSVSTYVGAFILDETTHDWTVHSTRTGMRTPWVYSHRIDANGVDWFGTAAGVISHHDGHYGRFSTDDGLPGNIVRDVAITDDGLLWFATDDGLAIYRSDMNPPRVRFLDAPSELSYGRPALLLACGFDVLRDTPNSQLTYKWRLDGGDWMTQTGRCDIQLPASLSAGKHTVEVFCIDRDHQVSPVAGHTFSVVRPLLARPIVFIPWILMLLASLATAVLALLNRRRLAAGLTELREARDRALSADRMKSQFVATMSHEIRTPLNVIIGYSDLLLESVETDEKREMLSFVRRSGRTLLQLINDVLDMARIESGRVELRSVATDVRDLADELIAMLSLPGVERDPVLVAELAPDIPEELWLDARRLRQVILNLLGNALRFTDRGKIELRISTTKTQGQLALVIEVEDTGIGIPEDRLEEIFQPFAQLDGGKTRTHGGSGLGLAICRRLLDVMGGSIEVRSRVGTGSCFRVIVPAHTSHPSGDDQPCIADVDREDVPAEAASVSMGAVSQRSQGETLSARTPGDKPRDALPVSTEVLLYGQPSRSRGFLERLIRSLEYEPRVVESIDSLRVLLEDSTPLAVFLDISEKGHEIEELHAALRERDVAGQVAILGLGGSDSAHGYCRAMLRSTSDVSRIRRLLRELSAERTRPDA